MTHNSRARVPDPKLHALDGEDLLTIPAASRVFPAARGCGQANPATVWRWCTLGVRVRGERLRLQHVRIGAYFYTSRQAIVRFLEALNAPANGQRATTSSIRTPTQRRRASDRAAKRLAGMGVKV
jgi:hypothetical protein